MKKTNTLPFVSLLLIATMVFAPLIIADEFGEFGGFDSGGFDGGDFGGFDSGGFDGGDFGGFDSGGFDGGDFGGFDSGGFDGGEYGGDSGFEGGDDFTGGFDNGPDFGGFPGPGGVPPGGDPGDFPPEADAVWQDLSDVTIFQGSPDGTLIQEDVFSKCTDPDSETLQFEITSTSANYELFFIDDDIRIFDLDDAFTGTETTTVTCNGVPEHFTLSVVPRTTTPRPGPAADEESDRLSVFIGAIIIPDAYNAQAGDTIPVTISFKNNGDHKLENTEGSVVIQELSVRASFGPVDLPIGKRVSKTVGVELPENVEPGMYTARIEIYSGSVHRIKHRDVEVIV
jgi:hypothetical protein